jgi:hypothetical protein
MKLRVKVNFAASAVPNTNANRQLVGYLLTTNGHEEA